MFKVVIPRKFGTQCDGSFGAYNSLRFDQSYIYPGAPHLYFDHLLPYHFSNRKPDHK